MVVITEEGIGDGRAIRIDKTTQQREHKATEFLRAQEEGEMLDLQKEEVVVDMLVKSIIRSHLH